MEVDIHNIKLSDLAVFEEFRIGDIFKVIKGQRLPNELKYRKNTIGDSLPFVTATSKDNGVGYYLPPDLAEQYGIIQHNNLITVSVLGDVFYHNSAAIGENTHVLQNNNLSKHNAMYVKTSLDKAIGDRFDYSHKLKMNRLVDVRVKLPVDTLGNPHWLYMEKMMQLVDIENHFIHQVLLRKSREVK